MALFKALFWDVRFYYKHKWHLLNVSNQNSGGRFPVSGYSGADRDNAGGSTSDIFRET